MIDIKNFTDNELHTFDISDINNDFIYQLIDYYLEEISSEPSEDLTQSITNLVDTIMSFYLLAQKNNVINIENSRKLLSLKMDKNPKDSILEQCKELDKEFDELEKYWISKSKTSSIPEIDYNQKTSSTSGIQLGNSQSDPMKNLNTEELRLIKKYTGRIIQSPVKKNDIGILGNALKKIYSKINTPIINFIVATVLFRITSYLIGF